jgi:8-oxo-dGTP pyrophosphatase MutT (NUDIX family)
MWDTLKRGVVVPTAGVHVNHITDDETLRALNKDVQEQYARMEYRPVVVAIIENGGGNVLFVRSRQYYSWAFPQGGVEKGEDILVALSRELEQEVGVTASEIGDVRFLLSDRFDSISTKDGFARGKQYYYFHMRLLVLKIFKKTKEVDDHRWVKPSDIPRFLYESVPKHRSMIRAVSMIIDKPK